ncbi:uncharacterized protein LOC127934413 [Carassius gibelio]|uniref:uncharacterized protein LOC127934413 n=1 Tax=Carassius gibelio TaxID=101364 RepID=UPI0022794C0D|nr:uncharacterized protein LOC127934413 [Carassius gibelio]
MVNQFVFVYLDDILIFSPSLQVHTQHVRQVLQRLLENQLYVKAEKCVFHAQSVPFLGFVVSAGEIKADPCKVRAVAEWPAPDSRKALQRFLGFANFYRRFIRNFGQIAAPLTALTSPKTLNVNSLLRWMPQMSVWARSYLSGHTKMEPEAAVPSALAFVRRCRRTWKKAKAALAQASRRTKAAADRHRTPAPRYVCGQRVWLSTKDLPLRVASRKLAPRFIGPYRITKVLSPAAVQLKLPTTLGRVHPVFHVSRVKPVFHSHLVSSAPTLPSPRLVDGSPVYTLCS